MSEFDANGKILRNNLKTWRSKAALGIIGYSYVFCLSTILRRRVKIDFFPTATSWANALLHQ